MIRRPLSLVTPLACALAAVACGGEPPTRSTPDDTDTFTYDPGDDDDDDTPVIPNDDEASLILFLWPPHFANPNPTVALGGVFVETRRGYENLAQCVAFTDTYCVEDLPETPDDYVVVDDFQDELLDELLSRDIGADVTLGDFTAPRVSVGALGVYYAPNAGAMPAPGAALDLSFGPGEWGEVSIPAAVTVPDALEITSPDLTTDITFTASSPLELRWTPGGTGDLYLSVVSRSESRLYLLEDDGEYDLSLTSLGLTEGDEVELALSRWSVETVDVDGHEVAVHVQYDQWMHGSWRDLGSRIEVEPADTCGEALTSVPVEEGAYWGLLDGYANDLNPGPNGCTDWDATGRDGLLVYEMEPYEFLDVSLTFPNDDAVVYLLTDCAAMGSCLDGSDTTGNAGTETASWYNESPDPLTVYIAIDSFKQNDDVFELDITGTVLTPDALYDTCFDAIAGGPVGAGVYIGDLGSYSNILDPGASCGPASPGAEGMVPVELLDGQTLTADVTMPGSNPTLYALYSCSVVESCAAESDVLAGTTESLTYTNLSGGSEIVYLVVDAADQTGQYVLNVDIN